MLEASPCIHAADLLHSQVRRESLTHSMVCQAERHAQIRPREYRETLPTGPSPFTREAAPCWRMMSIVADGQYWLELR